MAASLNPCRKQTSLTNVLDARSRRAYSAGQGAHYPVRRGARSARPTGGNVVFSAQTSPPAQAPRHLKAGGREWTGLAVLLLPLLLVSMDVSVLYFAVPFISRDLEPSSTEQLWILDIYGFVLAGFLITMGALGD